MSRRPAQTQVSGRASFLTSTSRQPAHREKPRRVAPNRSRHHSLVRTSDAHVTRSVLSSADKADRWPTQRRPVGHDTSCRPRVQVRWAGNFRPYTNFVGRPLDGGKACRARHIGGVDRLGGLRSRHSPPTGRGDQIAPEFSLLTDNRTWDTLPSQKSQIHTMTQWYVCCLALRCDRQGTPFSSQR